MGARVLLARHGQTEWHAENRYAGSSEVALTAEGLRQAGALARFAEVKLAALFCSPQDRARHTIAPAAEALGLTPKSSTTCGKPTSGSPKDAPGTRCGPSTPG